MVGCALINYSRDSLAIDISGGLLIEDDRRALPSGESGAGHHDAAGSKQLKISFPCQAIIMADPLSIAAGVTGILTAAAQISSLLIEFTSTSRDAPQTARAVLIEVNDIRSTLGHLQLFLSGNECSDNSRTQLLQVDQVVTIMSGCVLTFSELERVLDGLKAEGMGILDRAHWARKEKAISNLVQRLQNHKASLSLILHVLNGYVGCSDWLSIQY